MVVDDPILLFQTFVKEVTDLFGENGSGERK